jgi:hypothetical protein
MHKAEEFGDTPAHGSSSGFGLLIPRNLSVIKSFNVTVRRQLQFGGRQANQMSRQSRRDDSVGQVEMKSAWMLSKLMLLACLGLLALPSATFGQSSAFTYQGRLTDGSNPANGNYNFRFVLIDAAVGGNQIGPTLTNAPVAVTNGLFTALLDFGGAVFDGGARWLEIGVRTNGSNGAYVILSPRQAITAAPYAAFSSLANLSANLVGGGSGLTNIPGASIQSGSLTSSKMSAALWQLVTNGNSTVSAFITPYDCGAVGDGIVDDTVALQTWINRAATSNLVAFLPPAQGAFYKITSTLFVTNLNGLRMLGAGGEAHFTASLGAWSRSQIRQFTAGEGGLLIKDSPAGGLTDSIIIEGVVIAHNIQGNQTNSTSWGIGFDGSISDSDCNLMQSCAVFGFGRGLQLTSAADLSILSCSICANADGVFVGPSPAHPVLPVLNSLKIQTSQLSYNYSNQVHIAGGDNTTIDTCDLASVSPNSTGALLEEGSTLFLNCNFEHSGSNAAIIATHPAYRTSVVLSGGTIKDEAGFHPYAICATNSSLTLIGPGLYCADANGIPILIVSQFDSYMHVSVADAGWPIRFIVGASDQSTNTIGSFMTGMAHGPPQPLQPFSAGRLYSGQLTGGDQQSDLWYIARMGAYYGSNTPTAVSLLQYQKDKTTAASFNSVTATNGFKIGAVSWTSGVGSPEGVVTAVVGSLYTRTDGGAGTTLYVKQSGTGNTGWAAK